MQIVSFGNSLHEMSYYFLREKIKKSSALIFTQHASFNSLNANHTSREQFCFLFF